MTFIPCFFIFVLLIVLFYSLLVLYYTVKWRQGEESPVQAKIFSTSITIVIPVRDEEGNIENCLNAIAEQSYPTQLIEVLIVNDHSEDRTFERAEKLLERGYNFQHSIISLLPNENGKKAAIKKGVEQASGELIITTDADCYYPADWVKTMVTHYTLNNPKLLVAPVLLKEGNSFFNVFQQYEILSFAGFTGASIYAGYPLMCNGANLAFKRETFLEMDLLRDDQSILSGDDTFLLLKINEKYPGKTGFVKSIQASVMPLAHQSWSSLVKQRKRWASKVGRYNIAYIKWVGGIIYLMNFIVLVLVLIGFFNSIFFKWAFYSFICKAIVDIIFLCSVFTSFNKLKLIVYFLPVQVVYIFYLVFIVPASMLGKYEWKGRVSN